MSSNANTQNSSNVQLANSYALDPFHLHPYFTKVQEVSQGAQGRVLLVKDLRYSEENERAAKVVPFPFSVDVAEYMRREILNHMRLDHPHIVRIHSTELTTNHVAIIMDYMKGGDLRYARRQRGLPEYEAKWYFRQITFALDYAHRIGVCVRDIKLENILLDRNPVQHAKCTPMVKLCDFGLSKHDEADSKPHSIVGTKHYVAPEVIKVGMVPGGHATYDGPASDIWSLGVLLYVLVCGEYPFKRPEDALITKSVEAEKVEFQRILTLDYHFPTHVHGRQLSDAFKNLVSSMLQLEPQKRATLEDIMSSHWFIEDFDQKEWVKRLQTNRQLVEKSLAVPLSPEIEQQVLQVIAFAGQPR